MILDGLKEYKLFIRPGVTDMRKGSYSLMSIIESCMEKDPFEKAAFIFTGRSRRVIKILVWDNGFWLLTKTLEKGTFAWPSNEKEAQGISYESLKRLLTGEDVFRRIPVKEACGF